MTFFNWTKTLHICRGLPGSGKSTLALALVDGDVRRRVENDDYWFVPNLGPSDPQAQQGPYLQATDPTREFPLFYYKYDRPLTHLAADWCGAEAFRRLRIWNEVAVANVFAKREHVFGYLVEARKLGVRIKLHTPETQWGEDTEVCYKRDIHGVPLDVIEQMKSQWEELTQDEVDIFINLPQELRES